VAPLLLATGAGAASRRSLGTAVFSGMIAATVLAVFIVPVLFVVIDRLAERSKREATTAVEKLAVP
jgi:multidrug efflux pump subunit AcrB